MNTNDLDRLISENTPPTPVQNPLIPSSAPACDCVVRTKSGYQMQGALTKSGEGYKLAMPSMVADPAHPNNQRMAKKVLAEHFFDADAIECLVFLRPVDPALIQGVDRKPLIHMG